MQIATTFAIRKDLSKATLNIPVCPLAIALDSSAVGEGFNAVAVLQIIHELALVRCAIEFVYPAMAMHVAVNPRPHVDAAVQEFVMPRSIHHVVFEFPLVRRSVALNVDTRTMFFALHKLPFVPRAIWPGLNASPRLRVKAPFALVGRAVIMNVCAETMHLVLVPLALVGRAILVLEDAVAMHPGLMEVTLVLLKAIWADEDAPAMPIPASPLAFVLCATLHLHDVVLRGL
eukprot:CAMPEP_0117543478 /NCGR_PEP_ID=MMETSP0784-20121206/45082_1 /TAXON_ID=39447 /ORGANISM="" /LENGTH=230 /DNA_ID=CAMNT_0005340259 /DNA_START=33 /DNA_END=726 /DNA_ORIENTATION=+